MQRPLLYGLLGALIVSLDWILFRVHQWAQSNWEATFQQSGRLSLWWIISLASFVVGYATIATLSWMLVRKYSRSRLTPLGISMLVDLGVTVVLWSLSALFQDPLLSDFLASSGMYYLPSILLGLGIFWLLVGAARLKLLSPYLTGEPR